MSGGTLPVTVNFALSSPIAVDLEMLDTNLLENRPSLPTSLSDFALISSSSASAPSSPSSVSPFDDPINPFSRRLRRSSLLTSSPITLYSHQSGSPHGLRSKRSLLSAGSERAADFNAPLSSSSSTSSLTSLEAAPKSLSFDFNNQIASTSKTADFRFGQPLPQAPETPTSCPARRVPIPIKPPRLVDIKTELKFPIDSELKSEAQFQRLVASYSNASFPFSRNVPRTPRSWFDRGRYPEEAIVGDDDLNNNNDGESESDDDENATAPGSVQSVSMTPSGSITSTSGEDQPMTVDTNLIPGFMELDMQPLSAINSPTQWRETPPPASCRSNKRKFDDRYDPYPMSVKRRAVSPALHAHHHTQSRPGSNSHSPAIPIPIPRPTRSVTSSPVMRPASSPTMRPSSFGSPSVRSVPRLPPLASLRCASDSEKEREKTRKCIDGAEEAVGSLSLTE